MLTRDQILGAEDLSREEVFIPEWRNSVFVRCMTGAERDRFEAAHQKDPFADLRAGLAVATVCDAEGNLIFRPDDVLSVGRKSAAALDRIFAVAVRLSGITKADVDELARDFPNGRSAVSASGLPAISE